MASDAPAVDATPPADATKTSTTTSWSQWQVNDLLKSKVGIDLTYVKGKGEAALEPCMDKAKKYYNSGVELATPYVNDLMSKVNDFQSELTKVLDTDGDGKISMGEYAAGATKVPGLVMGWMKSMFGCLGSKAKQASEAAGLDDVLAGVDKMMQDKLGIDLGKYLSLNPEIDTSAPPPTAPADTTTATTK